MHILPLRKFLIPSPLWMVFFGIVAGLSTIPVPGFQLFFSLGLSLFLYASETPSFLKHPMRFMGAFAFGYFLTALHWVPCAFHVNWAHYFYLVPFALLGLPIFFGFYHMIGIWAVPWYRHKGFLRIAAFIMMWVLLEVVRAEFLTGFPWASLGVMWTTILPIAQLAAFIGPYGLSGLTLFWLAMPYVLISDFYNQKQKRLYAVLVMLSFSSAFFYGTDRINHAPRASTAPHYLRLVQPNMAQGLRWSEENMKEALELFIALSTRPSTHPLQAVVWPEFDFHLSLQRYPWMAACVKRAAPPQGLLIANGFRYERLNDGRLCVYNSMMIYNDQGEGVDFYDKHRLLPFGEYIPFRHFIDKIFPGQINKMSGGMGDFTLGIGPKILCPNGLPCFLPMICHESIFSGKFPTDEAQWILNLSNDGWFLHSLEPYQHLEMARMRAIETGLPLVRVANTGISAVIDPVGQVIATISYGQSQTMDISLPASLQERPFYVNAARWDIYSTLCKLIGILMVFRLIFWIRRRRQSL
jgi:apolipoprotein N-acyltransferase